LMDDTARIEVYDDDIDKTANIGGTPMNRLSLLTARYQMAIFLLLTYLISWAFLIPAEGGLIPHGPMIAAFIVLALISGWQGAAGLWRQMTRWRVGWGWYLVAPGILIVCHLFALAISLLLGAQIANTAHLRSLPAYLGMLVPLLLLGGQWEEPGWLGYALRRLQGRFAHFPLGAALVVGVMRMVWHTPLLLAGAIPWFDYVFASFALQIIFMWLYNRTNGSVLIPMICHLFSNLMFATIFPIFSGADQERYWVLMIVAEAVIAVGIVVATRGGLGQKPGYSVLSTTSEYSA
jgi:hypothetical protein